MRTLRGTLIAIVWLASLAGCSKKVVELSRYQNPSNTVDAVIATIGTDATVGTPIEVYIVGSNNTDLKKPAFRADNVEGIELKWESDQNLLISANSARIFLSTDKTDIESPQGANRIVQVRVAIKKML